METEYHSNRWLRILDIIGMVIAPISFSLSIIFCAIEIYQILSSTGNNYTDFIILFFGTIIILISLVIYFGWAIKYYMYNQATRDDIKAFRIAYSLFILLSLILFFMILSYYFFRL